MAYAEISVINKHKIYDCKGIPLCSRAPHVVLAAQQKPHPVLAVCGKVGKEDLGCISASDELLDEVYKDHDKEYQHKDRKQTEQKEEPESIGHVELDEDLTAQYFARVSERHVDPHGDLDNGARKVKDLACPAAD